MIGAEMIQLHFTDAEDLRKLISCPTGADGKEEWLIHRFGTQSRQLFVNYVAILQCMWCHCLS